MTTKPRTTPAKPRAPRAATPAATGHPGITEPEAPKSPAQREAEGIATTPVEWRGLTLEIPTDVDTWSYWNVIAPLAHGNETRALYGLLGNAQIALVQTKYPDMTAKDGRDLFDAINAALGLNSGN
ncbi:hypothetical protein BJY24_004145 [Nocardia transvalensis]|uniref:Tail assembly chaperone n=1 Tax=Nocardia transvalensis TaxID=37333 RepID=A0A7W9PGN1_9NOCA|nr:hypothetical protein [Nocardia transvalensis]MBB5915278.1 hypothetical protein [Nocardia transvalensis]